MGLALCLTTSSPRTSAVGLSGLRWWPTAAAGLCARPLGTKSEPLGGSAEVLVQATLPQSPPLQSSNVRMKGWDSGEG